MSTNSNGYFAFETVPTAGASYQLMAGYSGNEASSAVFSITGGQVTTVNIVFTSVQPSPSPTPAPTATPAVTATPAPTSPAGNGGVVQGYVTSPEGWAYHYVTARLLDASGAQIGSVTTDYNGRFEFHVPAGTTCKVYGEYAPNHGAYSDTFTVSAGQTVSRNIVIPYDNPTATPRATTYPSVTPNPSGTPYPSVTPTATAAPSPTAIPGNYGIVQGYITSPEGWAYHYVSAELLDASGAQISSQTTDYNGHFEFHVPGGTTCKVYGSYATGHGVYTDIFTVSAGQSITRNIAIPYANSSATPNPSITPYPADPTANYSVIQGSVTSPEGWAYHYVSAQLLDASGAQIGNLTTDYNGHFEFHVPPASNVTYRVYASYSPVNGAYSDAFSLSPGQSAHVDIVIPYAGSEAPNATPTPTPGREYGYVHGYVWAADGKTPIARATVVLLNGTSGAEITSKSTDIYGYYVFPLSLANNATYLVRATYGQNSSTSDAFAAGSRQAVFRNLTMTAVEPATLPPVTPDPVAPTATALPSVTPTVRPDYPYTPTATPWPEASYQPAVNETGSKGSSDLIGQIAGWISALFRGL